MKQRGFYNMDFSGFFVGLLVFGIAVGLILPPVVEWLWEILKPIIHEATK